MVMVRWMFAASALLASLSGGELDFGTATVGLYVVDSRTGKVLLEQGCNQSLVPASCMKVVTTGAALELLGPNMRFETRLVYDGAIEKGLLKGNLCIVGGGDPTLGSERFGGSWQQQIASWCDAVEKAGIREIEGEVIGDDSRWERAMAPTGWGWEDIGNYYGAGASALSFHENSYSLFFRPAAEVGEMATVLRLEPTVPGLFLESEVGTGPVGSGDRACIYGSEYALLQRVRGTIPAGVSEFSIRGAIPDPASTAALLLKQALEARGIQVVHRSFSHQQNSTVLHTTYSPPLAKILYWTNRRSINLYAEHLLKRMGEQQLGEGSTRAGIEAVTQFWRSKGIDLTGFRMEDGSGLSRTNLISAKQLVAILCKMKESSHFPLFLETLPEKKELFRLKPGGMKLVGGYAGYGGDLVFAVLVNNTQDPRPSEKLDRFLAKLVNIIISDHSQETDQ